MPLRQSGHKAPLIIKTPSRGKLFRETADCRHSRECATICRPVHRRVRIARPTACRAHRVQSVHCLWCLLRDLPGVVLLGGGGRVRPARTLGRAAHPGDGVPRRHQSAGATLHRPGREDRLQGRLHGLRAATVSVPGTSAWRGQVPAGEASPRPGAPLPDRPLTVPGDVPPAPGLPESPSPPCPEIPIVVAGPGAGPEVATPDHCPAQGPQVSPPAAAGGAAGSLAARP